MVKKRNWPTNVTHTVHCNQQHHSKITVCQHLSKTTNYLALVSVQRSQVEHFCRCWPMTEPLLTDTPASLCGRVVWRLARWQPIANIHTWTLTPRSELQAERLSIYCRWNVQDSRCISVASWLLVCHNSPFIFRSAYLSTTDKSNICFSCVCCCCSSHVELACAHQMHWIF